MKYIGVLHDRERNPLKENFDIESENEVDDDCKDPELLDGKIKTAIKDLN